MDPTESIKNLTFSLSVLDVALVLKADALAKTNTNKNNTIKKEGGRRGGRERAGEKKHCKKHLYNIIRILFYIFH